MLCVCVCALRKEDVDVYPSEEVLMGCTCC